MFVGERSKTTINFSQDSLSSDQEFNLVSPEYDVWFYELLLCWQEVYNKFIAKRSGVVYVHATYIHIYLLNAHTC
jgi:hypothetical protein